MREAEPLPVDLEDSGLERFGQSGLCPATGGRLDEAHRRVGERGNDSRQLEPGSPEAIDALVNELVQIRGNRQLLARTHPAASSLKRARELEGEERISARRFPDAQQRRSGKNNANASSQQLVKRADAERAELGIVRSRASGTPRRSQSGASSRAVRITATASVSRRGRANPSIASDGASSHWTSSIASSSRLPTASFRKVLRKANATTPSSAGGPFGFRERERSFERPPLRPRQLRQHFGSDASDQIGQPDKRKRRFRFGRPAGEHQVSARLRRLDGREPQRGLPDPGLAGYDATAGSPSRASRRARSAASSSSLPTSSRNPDCHAASS